MPLNKYLMESEDEALRLELKTDVEVVKKQALCAICRNGKKASFTKRLTNGSSQKLIGNTNYIPVCRECHKR